MIGLFIKIKDNTKENIDKKNKKNAVEQKRKIGREEKI